MNRIIYTLLVPFSIAVVIVSAADQQVYPPHNPVQRTHDTPLEYYLDHVDEFAKQAGQKRTKARLENYNPNSEVELVQPHQAQPPNPVILNIPNVVPDQRVIVVHWPVPGYRPAGGYPQLTSSKDQDNFKYTGNGYSNTVVLDPQTAPISSILDYDKNGILPPHEVGSSFQRPYDFYPNPKLNRKPGPNKNHQEFLGLLDEGKYTNSMHRLVYQKPIDTVAEFSYNIQKNREPTKRISDGNWDTLNMEDYETFLPHSENRASKASSKRRFFVQDPFDFIYTEPSREQANSLAVVQNPTRFIYLRSFGPSRKTSLSNIENTVYEYPNTVILEPSDPVMTGLSSFDTHDPEPGSPLLRPDAMYSNTIMPDNGFKHINPGYFVDPSANNRHNTLSRPDNGATQNKQQSNSGYLDEPSASEKPNIFNHRDNEVQPVDSKNMEDLSTKELKNILSLLLQKYYSGSSKQKDMFKEN